MALMKELDKGGLEFVRKDAEKKLKKLDEESKQNYGGADFRK